MNNYLSAVSGYVTSDKFSNNNEYYWLSSEYDSSDASNVYFGSDGNLILRTYGKGYIYRVRSVVAF